MQAFWDKQTKAGSTLNFATTQRIKRQAAKVNAHQWAL
jgi:hypothetical protein|tara:strand:- start:124 stop:237 length:114 start_codon:yes stop_codon:yes gene_type:complete